MRNYVILSAERERIRNTLKKKKRIATHLTVLAMTGDLERIAAHLMVFATTKRFVILNAERERIRNSL